MGSRQSGSSGAPKRVRAGLARLGLAGRQLTPREWTLLILAALFVYALLAGALVYGPFAARLREIREELGTARAGVAHARECEARQSETETRIAELTAAGGKLGRRLPAGPDEVTFVYRCWQWQRATGVSVQTLTLRQPVPAGEGRDQVVNLTLVGSYGAQVAFLAELEEGEALVKVEQATLVSTGGGDLLRGDYIVHIFSQAGQQTAPEVVKAGVRFTRTAGRGDPFSP